MTDTNKSKDCDDIRDGQHVDTEELKSCIEDGFSPKSTMKVYAISKKEYERVINSKINVNTEIGKSSPLREDD